MGASAGDKSPDGRKARASRSKARQGFIALLAIAVLGGLVGLEISGTTNLLSRVTAWLGKGNDNFVIVAVHGDGGEDSNVIRGARLALEEVNQSGGVLGRQLDLELAVDQPDFNDRALEATVENTLTLADRIVTTKNLLAVMGHNWSDSAIPASAVYNRNNVLFFATHATAAALTNHRFDTVFALQPNNPTNARIIGNYALKQGNKRFIVLSDKTLYGKESANFFMEIASNACAEIVFRSYLNSSTRSLDKLLMFILNNDIFSATDYDAIFVVTSATTDTSDFIRSARSLGIDVPIYGMEYIFSSEIENDVDKKYLRGVAGVSLYSADSITGGAQGFAEAYKARYNGEAPDLEAAIGYDTVILIRDLVERTGETDAVKLSDALKLARYKRPFVGVTGPLTFDQRGLIADTPVYVVRHDGTQFHTVESYEIPISWANISTHCDDVGKDGVAANKGVEPPMKQEAVGQ